MEELTSKKTEGQCSHAGSGVSASPEKGSGDPGELCRLEQEISAQKREIEEKNQQIEKLVRVVITHI